jgi:hypothetical protein
MEAQPSLSQHSTKGPQSTQGIKGGHTLFSNTTHKAHNEHYISKEAKQKKTIR